MLQNIFRLSTRKVYSILGPEKSSLLAQSIFGKLIFSILNPDSNSMQIYSGIDGIKLKLTREESYTTGFFHLGVINPNETSIIKKILKPGDIFIDIGAYVDGWHSLVAARIVGEKGHVYTFEPLYHKRLSENIKLNNLKNIKLFDIAISDKTSEAYFYDNEERSSLVKKHIYYKSKKKKVKTLTLDSLLKLNKIKHPNLLKIDVEGSEMDVLKGARQLLKSDRAPDLILEVVDYHLKEGGSSEKEVLETLKKLGYKIFAFGPKGLVKYTPYMQRKENNLFCTKKPNNSLMS